MTSKKPASLAIKRIYLVREFAEVSEVALPLAEHLVLAGSQAQALRTVVGKRFGVVIASPLKVAQLLTAGQKILGNNHG